MIALITKNLQTINTEAIYLDLCEAAQPRYDASSDRPAHSQGYNDWLDAMCKDQNLITFDNGVTYHKVDGVTESAKEAIDTLMPLLFPEEPEELQTALRDVSVDTLQDFHKCWSTHPKVLNSLEVLKDTHGEDYVRDVKSTVKELTDYLLVEETQDSRRAELRCDLSQLLEELQGTDSVSEAIEPKISEINVSIKDCIAHMLFTEHNLQKL